MDIPDGVPSLGFIKRKRLRAKNHRRVVRMLEFTTYIENKAPEGSLAQLEVRIHMYGGWGEGLQGEMLITPGLICATEVDYYVDRLIEALQRVRIEAKAKLGENEWS